MLVSTRDAWASGRKERPSRRIDIRFFLSSICILAAGLSCPSETATGPSVRPAQEPDRIILFFTGNELGALKPCGCSGGQLGGLSKRAAIFGRVPPGRRTIIDTGALVGSDQEQDLVKFGVLFEALGLLGYDVAHLTRQDVEIARSLGLLSNADRPFKIISGQWGPEAGRDNHSRSFGKEFRVNGRNVVVNVLALDAHSDPIERAGEFFAGRPDRLGVGVLILQNCDAQSRRAWARQSGADCLVCPTDADEPQILSEPGTKPLIFTPGRFGRHVVRLEVDFSGPQGELVLSFRDVPVDEALPEDEALEGLYKQYQLIVRQSGLLERYPRVPLPDDLRYAGSKECASCHEYEYAKWSTKAHADAFATLVEVGSDYDPECVICHVVGMDRASGFVTASLTPEMKNVGCENCHGPGSEHVRTLGQAPTVEPKSTCLDCHTPEHSSGYAGHEAEYLKKIVHWREP